MNSESVSNHFCWSSKALWMLVIFCAVLSIARGLYPPSVWTVSHYSMSYAVQFSVRGLVGTIFDFLLGSSWYKYDTIAAVIVVVWVAGLSGLAMVCRCVANVFPQTVLVALIFFSSPAFVYYNYSIGYFDHIGFLGVIILLLLSRRGQGRWAFYCIATLMIFLLTLVHEGQFLLWGAAFFWILANQLSSGESIRCRHLMVAALLTAMPFAIALLLLGRFGALSPEQAMQLHDYVASRADFTPRRDAFDYLSGSLDRTRHLMKLHWAHVSSWLGFLRSLLINAPALILVGLAASSLVWARGATIFGKCALVMLMQASICSPLILCFYGFDIHRWCVACVLGGFFSFLVFAGHSRSTPAAFKLIRGCALPALCLNLNSANDFFMNQAAYQYPFFERITWLVGYIQGLNPFIVIPGF